MFTHTINIMLHIIQMHIHSKMMRFRVILKINMSHLMKFWNILFFHMIS